MIIECPACSKKFNIDEKLIPDEGRLLKCGNCDHTWFFKKEENIKLETETTKINEIEEAYVFGVPDKSYGEIVGCWVKLKENQKISPEDIQNKCKNQIATYKIPSFVRLVNNFPVTASGKIQKFKMSEKELALKL